MSSKKAKPPSRPMVTGHTFPPLISMPGMSKDHTEAATITPEANPRSTFCSIADISFRMKKTKADPSAVPAKGISRPIKIASILRSFTVQR